MQCKACAVEPRAYNFVVLILFRCFIFRGRVPEVARAPVPVIMDTVVKCVTAVRMAIMRKSRTILTQSAKVCSQIHFIDYQNEILQC